MTELFAAAFVAGLGLGLALLGVGCCAAFVAVGFVRVLARD